MLAFPAVCDALTAAFTRALGSGSQVFDGPPTQYVGLAGVSVGATREDISSEFTAPPAGLDGASGEDIVVSCLAWSGSGSTTFKPHRDVVLGYLAGIEAELAIDRSLAGAVDAAFLTGGTWTQNQTGSGALVTCEFRVTCRRF